MFILKSFKSFVLKLRIPKGLGVCFSEVRILNGIGEKRLKVESLKLKLERLGEKQSKVDPSTTFRARSSQLNGERFGELNTETQSTQRPETGRDLEIGAGAQAGVGFNAEVAEFTEKGGRPPTPGYPRVMK
jgi:hypothetical protein